VGDVNRFSGEIWGWFRPVFRVSPVEEFPAWRKTGRRYMMRGEKNDVRDVETLPEKVSDGRYEETAPGMVPIVKPLVSPEQVREAVKRYEEIKRSILGDSDILYIGSDGKPCEKGKAVSALVKRSGWRKIKLAFGISLEILEMKKEWGEDGEGKYYTWLVRARATAPNGIFCDSWGACTSRDPFFSKKHGVRIDPRESDIILKAQTVAYNRAISDLVGGGEVSAEEMPVPEEEKPVPRDERPKPEKKKKEDVNFRDIWYVKSEIIRMATSGYFSEKDRQSIVKSVNSMKKLDEVVSFYHDVKKGYERRKKEKENEKREE